MNMNEVIPELAIPLDEGEIARGTPRPLCCETGAPSADVSLKSVDANLFPRTCGVLPAQLKFVGVQAFTRSFLDLTSKPAQARLCFAEFCVAEQGTVVWLEDQMFQGKIWPSSLK